MARRSSVKKTEWSANREDHYKRECQEILFNHKLQLNIEGNRVYLKSETSQILLTTILKPKTVWYETWLKLKEI